MYLEGTVLNVLGLGGGASGGEGVGEIHEVELRRGRLDR